ncbi:hypothetical protein SAMN04487970_100346 [Paenibacillus tianmuensis]|uniref:Uncharacterized protein n=1 Tax=Paenibacillus tianmuensis TaxID=624147 RepID=A0A1G4PLT5_9BACL|nr:hypothetical protein SAMN04487970_100346 [Paenibacillus tianmuensis]
MFANIANSSADDQNLLRIRMCKQRNMNNHFVIDKFIPLRRHNHIVQQQHVSELLSFYHIELIAALKTIAIYKILLQSDRKSCECFKPMTQQTSNTAPITT